ncbi:DMT family transporter [Shewanella dokdonensis]|uniref:DMT family transporter n=1 Tax=Shewanella dokdonensis TaxID=712036 RepID=A0ABX8DDK9_9GAMM|nr:DMT family transporter [Shewanella dokdonensis]MCL1073347.1 DMT family transporter [Shewanella dokdonensis]QVK22829.1 DMT family transporter [Shewanella dokdonensis]
MDLLTTAQSRCRWRVIGINILLIALPPLFWAGNFIVGRAIRHDVPPITLAFYRWVIALLILLPFSVVALKRDWHQYWQHPWLILGLSITGITAFNTLLYVGLQTTAATNGLILNSCVPLIILLLGALLFKQPLRRQQIAGMLLSFSGVLMIVCQGNWQLLAALEFTQGDLIIFSALICWAFYTQWLKCVPPQISRVGLMSLQMLLGLLLLAPFYVWESGQGTAMQWNLHALLALAYVGIIPSIAAYLLYNACVDRLGPAAAGMSIYLMPVFGVVLSVSLLGELVHWYQLTGIGLIFLGIFAAGMLPKWRTIGATRH